MLAWLSESVLPARVRVLPAPGFYYTQARALLPPSSRQCPRAPARGSVCVRCAWACVPAGVRERARLCPEVRACPAVRAWVRPGAGACLRGRVRASALACCVCACACLARSRTCAPGCSPQCVPVRCLPLAPCVLLWLPLALSGCASCSGRWREDGSGLAVPRDYTLDSLSSCFVPQLSLLS